MSVLEAILAGVREDLAGREAAIPLVEVKAAAATAPAPLPVLSILREPGVGVVFPGDACRDSARREQDREAGKHNDDRDPAVWREHA